MDVDLFGPDSVRDPWPGIEQVQREGPVIWNGLLDHWMVTTDRLSRKILLDSEHFTLSEIVTPLFGEGAFIGMDDRERHDALRGVWAVAFQRATLDRIKGVIGDIADQMIDPLEARLRAGEVVEAVGAFCRDFPAYVIAYMLGVPAEVRPKIVEWSDKVGGGGAVAGADRASDPAWIASEHAKAELADYLLEQIAYRRTHPDEDLISQIVHSGVGRGLSDQAIMENSRQLLFAGNETTAKWLGHIVVTLAEHPDDRRAVRETPSLLPAAVEEVMRWEPVVHRIPRVVHGEIELEGAAMMDGDQVLLLIGAANRDPQRYADPARFDIRRDAKSHLGFGYGMHSCLGVTLARLEAQVAISRLLARIPDFTLAGDVDYGAFGLRGPVTVPIAVA